MVNFDFSVCTLFAKSVIYFIPLLLMCERTFYHPCVYAASDFVCVDPGRLLVTAIVTNMSSNLIKKQRLIQRQITASASPSIFRQIQ